MKCVGCEREIVGRRSDAKYCSDTCRSAAEKRRYRERKGLAVNPRKGPYAVPRVIHEKRAARLKISSAKRNQKLRDLKAGEPSSYSKARALGFRSMFEVNIDRQLRAAGVDYKYESFKLDYVIHGSYTPDILLPNGIVVECKGFLDVDAKRKMIAVKNSHPHLDIRFCFYDASAKVANSKKTHGEWADRNGFKWSDGSIPQDWLDE